MIFCLLLAGPSAACWTAAGACWTTTGAWTMGLTIGAVWGVAGAWAVTAAV